MVPIVTVRLKPPGPHLPCRPLLLPRDQGLRLAQNPEPGVCRKASSSALDTRPKAALRWGKRPNWAITSRCLMAKSAVLGSTNCRNSGRDASCTARPELAGELIEQQHQRQRALGGFAPAAQLAGDGLAGEAQESLPQQRISCR